MNLNRIRNEFYVVSDIIGLTDFIKYYVLNVNNCVRLKHFNDHPIFLRNHTTSDWSVFKSVFTKGFHLPVLKLRNNPVIIDVGSNIGLTMVHLKLLYEHSNIYGIEMDPKNFSILKKNIASFDSCSAINKALWINNEKVHYSIKANEDSYSIDVSDLNTNTQYVIDGITIDQIMVSNSISFIDYIKIDVEGAEVTLFLDSEINWLEFVMTFNIEVHDEKHLDGIMKRINSIKGIYCWRDSRHWSAIVGVNMKAISNLSEVN